MSFSIVRDLWSICDVFSSDKKEKMALITKIDRSLWLLCKKTARFEMMCVRSFAYRISFVDVHSCL